jgi:hypothetical protein
MDVRTESSAQGAEEGTSDQARGYSLIEVYRC